MLISRFFTRHIHRDNQSILSCLKSSNIIKVASLVDPIYFEGRPRENSIKEAWLKTPLIFYSKDSFSRLLTLKTVIFGKAPIFKYPFSMHGQKSGDFRIYRHD